MIGGESGLGGEGKRGDESGGRREEVRRRGRSWRGEESLMMLEMKMKMEMEMNAK